MSKVGIYGEFLITSLNLLQTSLLNICLIDQEQGKGFRVFIEGKANFPMELAFGSENLN